MKITETTARKIIITNVPDLDPVTLYLEDYGNGAGEVTITCFSESWNYYWSHMGAEHTMTSFFLSASVDYLANKFMGAASHTEYDLDKTVVALKKELIRRRREGEKDKEEIRESWDLLRQLDELPTSYNHHHADILNRAMGDEWHYYFESRPTHQWEYLMRIVETVKKALKQHDGN